MMKWIYILLATPIQLFLLAHLLHALKLICWIQMTTGHGATPVYLRCTSNNQVIILLVIRNEIIKLYSQFLEGGPYFSVIIPALFHY